MGIVQIEGTLWLTRTPRGAARRGRDPRTSRRAALAGRVAMVAAVAGLTSFATAALTSSQAPSLVGSAVASGEPRAKENARIAAWPAAGAFQPSNGTAKGVAVIAGAVAPIVPAALMPPEDWREETFQVERAVDGRTFISGGRRVMLTDLLLPAPSDVCRRLDGVVEACAARATTQLDLLTRWRTLTCRVRVQGAGDLAGSCRLGGDDLADRLVRAGFVKRPAPDRGAGAQES
jgi:hypothetical protein